MDIKQHEIKNILKTLPIGYYCGRKIDVDINNELPSSAYSPTIDKIMINTDMMVEGLKNAEETPEFSKETATRSMLYHEVSHAILTPQDWNLNMIENIFEDERIETLLKGYYMDTNFKKLLLNLNNGKVEVDWNDPDSVFFSTVRFRTGKPEHVRRVQEIIDKYDKLNCSSERYSYHGPGWFDYRDEIHALYREIYDDINRQPRQDQNQQDQKNQQANDNLNQMANEEEQIMKDNQEKRASQKPNQGNDQNQGNGQNQNNEGNNNGEGNQPGQAQYGQAREGESEGEEAKELKLGKAAGMDMLKNALQKTQMLYRDPVLAQQLEAIFTNFNKKNSGGNSTVSYNGRVNPRNLIRDDYKYFDKRVMINGNNKYGTCHLNLFIDDSGSFSDSKDRVNVLLTELAMIEKHNKNFTFDLIRCGSGMSEVDKEHRYITASGGTHLDFKETRDIFNRHQKRNTAVYNIVLYDGDCSGCGSCDTGYRHPFKYFDRKNTTMILESSNRRNVEISNMESATIVYEDKNYTGELTKHVLRALNIGFR